MNGVSRGTVTVAVIEVEHCESCGATDYESLMTGDQGYTACCNEVVAAGGSCESHGCGHR